MPAQISKSEAISLLRKAQEESLPTELVGMGQNQQAVFVIGFVSVNDEEESAFSIYVPGQIAVTFDLETVDLNTATLAKPHPSTRQEQIGCFSLQLA